MVAYPGRLPARFPEGTKYVVEGRGGVFTRFIELPDGTQYALPNEPVERTRSRRLRARRPTRRR
jgi:hypothetical protein